MSDIPPAHLTGRGGAGNFAKDSGVEYTDSGIVREGLQGYAAEGEYSSGRGGAGNIVDSPQIGPRRGSQDVVPESNLIPSEGHENFHTGRGGGGNVHKEKYGGHTHDPNKPTFIDKAKGLFSGQHKDKEAKAKVDGRSQSTST